MAENALITYIGPDRAGIISKITGRVFELGGDLGDVTFTAQGEDAEMKALCEVPKDMTTDRLAKELSGLPEVQDGDLKVEPFQIKTMLGPSSRVTHRIILSGGDRRGLVAKITKILDEYGANIVRMNAERLVGASGKQYISRFAISLREERAPACLASIVSLAGKLKLTFRYETA